MQHRVVIAQLFLMAVETALLVLVNLNAPMTQEQVLAQEVILRPVTEIIRTTTAKAQDIILAHAQALTEHLAQVQSHALLTARRALAPLKQDAHGLLFLI